MTTTYYHDLEQGCDDWLNARIGVLTASEMKLILTPTLKIANNDKTRQHVYEIAAQRTTRHVEPFFIGDDMLRGYADEILARDLYSEKEAPVVECGFITNDDLGFTIGYSPDGLVGDDGLIECKSRRQKYQFQTIAEGDVPEEYMLQLQTGLLVSGRKWIDFISYSGGMPMIVKRVFPDAKIQTAIIDAATKFEEAVTEKISAYTKAISSPGARAYPTERNIAPGDFTDGEY